MKNTFLNTILSKLTAILFFVLVLFPNLAIAQADAKLDLLIEKLDKENDDAGLIGDGGLGRQGGEQEGYKSFVQNELQNITNYK